MKYKDGYFYYGDNEIHLEEGSCFMTDENGYFCGIDLESNEHDNFVCRYRPDIVRTFNGNGIEKYYKTHFYTKLDGTLEPIIEYLDHEYDGEYRDGKRHGDGKFISFSEQYTYIGKFKNGDFHGEGIKEFENGEIQKGKF